VKPSLCVRSNISPFRVKLTLVQNQLTLAEGNRRQSTSAHTLLSVGMSYGPEMPIATLCIQSLLFARWWMYDRVLGEVLSLVPSQQAIELCGTPNPRIYAVSLLGHIQYPSLSTALSVFWVTRISRTLFDYSFHP